MLISVIPKCTLTRNIEILDFAFVLKPKNLMHQQIILVQQFVKDLIKGTKIKATQYSKAELNLSLFLGVILLQNEMQLEFFHTMCH